MKKDDLQRVVEIMGEGVEDGASTFRRICPDAAAWDAEHFESCRIVAEVDGKVEGFCALCPFSKREEYHGVGEVSIYIARACRRHKLGERLLSALVAESEQRGFWSLEANIFSTNAPSVRLHEKLGFRLVGTRERLARDRFGEWRDVLIFERRIKE